MSTPGTKKRTRRRTALPKSPPRPRVATNAPPVSDSEGNATLGDKVVAAAEANPGTFVNPPSIPPLKTAISVLRPAIVAAQGGSDAQQSALLTATTKVHRLILQHGHWVQEGADNLPPAEATSYITLSGFGLAKTPQRTPITAPVLSNTRPGGVGFELPRIPGAIMWFTEVALPGKDFVGAVDTEHIKGEITGLPSGQTVTIRLRPYVRGSGYGPWTTLTITVT